MSTSMTVTTSVTDTTLERAVERAYNKARAGLLDGFLIEGVSIGVSLMRTIASVEPVAFEVELDLDATEVGS